MEATKARVNFEDTLPPELRDRVYDLALISTAPLHIDRRQECPALFLVNKEISEEAISSYYKGNDFAYTLDYGLSHTLFASKIDPITWIEHSIGTEKAKLIKSLKIKVLVDRRLGGRGPKEIVTRVHELFAGKYMQFQPMMPHGKLVNFLASFGLARKAVKMVHRVRKADGSYREVDLLVVEDRALRLKLASLGSVQSL